MQYIIHSAEESEYENTFRVRIVRTGSGLVPDYPDGAPLGLMSLSGYIKKFGGQNYIGTLRTTVPDWWGPNPRRETQFPDWNLVSGLSGLVGGRVCLRNPYGTLWSP